MSIGRDGLEALCEELNARRAAAGIRRLFRIDRRGEIWRLAEYTVPLPRPRIALREIESNERWLNAPAQADMRSAGLKCGALENVNGKVRYTFRPA